MKNNLEKYKWGIFYVDRQDSRIIVPKVDRMRGWTLNFGNPMSYFILSLLIVVIVLVGYYT